jgi:hypothetical protein
MLTARAARTSPLRAPADARGRRRAWQRRTSRVGCDVAVRNAGYQPTHLAATPHALPTALQEADRWSKEVAGGSAACVACQMLAGHALTRVKCCVDHMERCHTPANPTPRSC